MNNKELNEMIVKNFDGYTKEQILNASVFAGVVKKKYAEIQEKANEKLESMMSVGDQLSLDFGSETYTSSMVETSDIFFDVTDEDLYRIAQADAPLYCTHGIDKTSMKKDYKKGVLPKCLNDHVVINTQAKMKLTHKEKKGE